MVPARDHTRQTPRDGSRFRVRSISERSQSSGRAWRTIARSGVDPIKERERLVREAAKSDHTLKSVALEAFEARKAELKGDGRSGR